MSAAGSSLVTAFDYAWERFTDRIDGLTDAEYHWAPVAGMWDLRPDEHGRWRLDGPPPRDPQPEPAPVTTIAWRIVHLSGPALGDFATRLFGSPEPGPYPGTSADVPAFVAEQYGHWRDGMAALDEDTWWAPLGPAWGPYAEANHVDLALHVLDEVVHHAAEVGVLRDLYVHLGGPEPG